VQRSNRHCIARAAPLPPPLGGITGVASALPSRYSVCTASPNPFGFRHVAKTCFDHFGHWLCGLQFPGGKMRYLGHSAMPLQEPRQRSACTASRRQPRGGRYSKTGWIDATGPERSDDHPMLREAIQRLNDASLSPL
jgi:hypothetical protein